MNLIYPSSKIAGRRAKHGIEIDGAYIGKTLLVLCPSLNCETYSRSNVRMSVLVMGSRECYLASVGNIPSHLRHIVGYYVLDLWFAEELFVLKKGSHVVVKGCLVCPIPNEGLDFRIHRPLDFLGNHSTNTNCVSISTKELIL